MGNPFSSLFPATFDLWAVLRIAILVFLLFNTLFSFLVVRQVQAMVDTLETGLEWGIRIFSWLYLLLSALALILTFLSLQ